MRLILLPEINMPVATPANWSQKIFYFGGKTILLSRYGMLVFCVRKIEDTPCCQGKESAELFPNRGERNARPPANF